MKTAVLISSALLVLGTAGPAMAETDPFPGISVGQEIPGTRVNSAPGESSESFDAGVGSSHSCPNGSGRGMGVDMNFTSDRSDDIRYYYCVKTWQPSSVTSAWDAFNAAVDAAIDSAQAQSLAWNQANPGKQKCVSWGPLTDPNGGTRSGGVCANPVAVPGGVPSQDADGVGEGDVADGVVGLIPTPANPLDPTPAASAADAPRGSGYPFTVVLAGQLGTNGCPSGFQAANGLIVDASNRKEFTECWPTNAWTAHQLGGDAWSLFKATGGTYDPAVEIDRRAKVQLLKDKAKEVALLAANQTPGIERCSSWSGYEESGKECAYVFVNPDTKEKSFTEGSAAGEGSGEAIEVGLDRVSISGTTVKVAAFPLSITPKAREAKAISSLINSFNKLKSTTQVGRVQLPKNSKIKMSVKSMDKASCQISKKSVQIRSKSTCTFEVKITDSVGNSYTFSKSIRRTT